jgi:GxxExxY protein
MSYLFEEQTYQIIGAAQEVHRELGPGFLEIVYKDALEIEFQQRDIPYIREAPIPIYYKGIPLNRTFKADFLCYNQIIIEAKAVQLLNNNFQAQVINYLKGSHLRLGLLLNFGEPSLKIKRLIN